MSPIFEKVFGYFVMAVVVLGVMLGYGFRDYIARKINSSDLRVVKAAYIFTALVGVGWLLITAANLHVPWVLAKIVQLGSLLFLVLLLGEMIFANSIDHPAVRRTFRLIFCQLIWLPIIITAAITFFFYWFFGTPAAMVAAVVTFTVAYISFIVRPGFR